MNNGIVHILGISGSLRRGSYNRRLLRAAREVAPEWVELDVFEIGQLPLFSEDIESEGDPAPVLELKRRIRESDALLIATPEYNGSMPGALVNATDWASRPPRGSALRGKPVAVMGAAGGSGGAANAQEALRGVLERIGASVLRAPVVAVGRARDAFDADGKLVDERVREQIRELVYSLADRAGVSGSGEDGGRAA